MPDQPTSTRCALREVDEQLQAAILSHALSVFPAPLTPEEVVLDVIGGSQVFGERDAAQNALHSLLRDGILRQSGDLILPIRAVVRFNQLQDAVV